MERESMKDPDARAAYGFQQVAGGPEPGGPSAGPRGPAPGPGVREIVLRSVLVIALVVLGLAVLYFLFAVNQTIVTWFQPQWVPVARAVAALAAIALSLFVLVRLTREGSPFRA
jgi:hypothetical protein